MKRFIAHSEDERNHLSAKGFREVGREQNGNYVFWSNNMEDVLSQREKEVHSLKHKSDDEISELLGISTKSVKSYREKIKSKGF